MEVSISTASIPDLTGKSAVITGGAYGIGLEIARLLDSRHVSKVFILSRSEPQPNSLPPTSEFIQCDISSWSSLRQAFKQVGSIDFLFANAGVLPEEQLLVDKYDDEGELCEPEYPVIDTNLRGTLNTIKLGVHNMRRAKRPGAVVITSSSTGYIPEPAMPVFSAVKNTLIALVRSLRAILIEEEITINAIAPAATETKLLPKNFAQAIRDAGLPVCTAECTALAAVYSATSTGHSPLEDCKPYEMATNAHGRWNGRVILSIGDILTEVEGPLMSSRSHWFGQKNVELTAAQQSVTQRLLLRNA